MKANKSQIINITSILIVVIALAVAGYFYWKYKSATSAAETARREVESTVNSVSALMMLPTDETPTLATVSDKGKLADQEFFKNAENGDKVLIYTKSKKAILYRPATNKIVDVAPIRTIDQQEKPTPTPPPVSAKIGEVTVTVSPTPAPITVAMYNGTDTQGLSYKLESVLKLKFPILVNNRQEAAKKDYTKTIVVDVTGKASNQAKDIAAYINADVTTLPKGETEPDNDILIIIGSDKK